MMTTLLTVPTDVLVQIFLFLTPPDILAMRQTSKTILHFSKSRIVWTNALVYHVISKGFPYPLAPLKTPSPAPAPPTDVIPEYYHTLSLKSLEALTIHAFRLGSKWRSLSPSFTLTPRRLLSMDVASSTAVSDVRFVPGHPELLVVVSKSVWSVISIWDIRPRPNDDDGAGGKPRKCCDWSPRGAIFDGFAVNSDPDSKVLLAVSILVNGQKSIELLSLHHDRDRPTSTSLHSILSHPTPFRPTTLQGSILALADDVDQAAVWDWEEGAYAVLDGDGDRGGDGDGALGNGGVHPGAGMWKNDKCLQIMFAYQSVVVVRARSMCVFPFPELKRLQEGEEGEREREGGVYTTPDGDGDGDGGSPAPLMANSDTQPQQQNIYTPLTRHSFGWVDGICMAPRLSPPASAFASHLPHSHPPYSYNHPHPYPPLQILVRTQTDDPWSTEAHRLKMYTMDPNPAFFSPPPSPSPPSPPPPPANSNHHAPTSNHHHHHSYSHPPPRPSPYLPPALTTHTTPSNRGQLRCPTLLLGSFGTGVWVVPRKGGTRGLVWGGERDGGDMDVGEGNEEDGNEKLVGASFHPDEERAAGITHTRTLLANDPADGNGNYTSLDYDEMLGRVVLGYGVGRVVVVEL